MSVAQSNGWPDPARSALSGAKFDAKGKVESVQAMMNYQEQSVERTIVRNGKIISERDASGSDLGIKGARWVSQEVCIRNGRSESLSLDCHGFELRESPTAMSYDEFYDHNATIGKYYRECAELVKSATGASIVECFDHNVRSAAGKSSGKQISGGSSVQGPASLVHGDYTVTSGPDRLQQLGKPASINDTLRPLLGNTPLLSKEAIAKARKGRYAIVNVWRNIRPEPVETFPLACCDAQSVVANRDLCVFEIHYADRIGENYFCAHSSDHRWYYYPQMRKDEALILKTWDSAGTLVGGSKATFTLHAAFQDPTASPCAPDRESIEVRCIVIFDDGEETDAPVSKL